ncbi:hypothetical protein HPP92_028612 [Vanilla planifolia]|uniref:Uncharacterized protein n=1 Tax=Vanilla planifolia TaxID=51239 RepID=A0A835U2Z3_VANPL|nr:hypothetical protein HPP92_028612 [Vanilla planifolia]KAG0446933.1 hypothetical protein HPP92_028606 [Vanilla planifolia]
MRSQLEAQGQTNCREISGSEDPGDFQGRRKARRWLRPSISIYEAEESREHGRIQRFFVWTVNQTRAETENMAAGAAGPALQFNKATLSPAI